MATIKLGTSIDGLCVGCEWLKPFASLARSGAEPPRYGELEALLASSLAR